jgi:small subunit ribosomal protein S21
VEVTVLSRDIEKALRSLKKKLQLDGVFGELKKRRFYEKPSVKKKRKQLEAQKRKRKLLKRSRQASWSPRPGTGNAAHPARRPTATEAGGMK